MNSAEKASKIVVICGPTASGKSDLAIRLAKSLDAEIINADSMQIYRSLDIGTAKPSLTERTLVPHHLIDIVSLEKEFSAADFAVAADFAIRDISKRSKRVIVVGGTGLYIKALLHGLVDSPAANATIRKSLQDQADIIGNDAMLERLREVDPALAAGLHPNNLVRIIRALEVHQVTGKPLSKFQNQHAFALKRYDSLQLGISTERSVLYNRIEKRVDDMLESGLFEEVHKLLSEGYDRNLKPMRSIGYKETVAHILGEITSDEAIRLIKLNTRHYAKRQLTWFKADKNILWFDYPENFDSILKTVVDFFDNQESHNNVKSTF